jgi:hypothetical protein
MSKELREMIDRVRNYKKSVNESYDLVSQFKGNHHGNPMPKNKYLNSLGLDQIWINLMQDDKSWFSKTYPKGSADYVDLISYISEKVKDLKSFVKKYKSVNPIKVVNFLKD